MMVGKKSIPRILMFVWVFAYGCFGLISNKLYSCMLKIFGANTIFTRVVANSWDNTATMAAPVMPNGGINIKLPSTQINAPVIDL